MGMRPKVKIGDIFRIKINSDAFVFGQIIARAEGDFEYIVIFDLMIEGGKVPSFQELQNSNLLVLAQLSGGVNRNPKRENWEVVDNRPIIKELKLPEYKVAIPNGWAVERWDRQILRVGNNQDVSELKFRKEYSPSLIESTIKAHFGFKEWLPYYDEILLVHRKIS